MFCCIGRTLGGISRTYCSLCRLSRIPNRPYRNECGSDCNPLRPVQGTLLTMVTTHTRFQWCRLQDRFCHTYAAQGTSAPPDEWQSSYNRYHHLPLPWFGLIPYRVLYRLWELSKISREAKRKH